MVGSRLRTIAEGPDKPVLTQIFVCADLLCGFSSARVFLKLKGVDGRVRKSDVKKV